MNEVELATVLQQLTAAMGRIERKLDALVPSREPLKQYGPDYARCGSQSCECALKP